MTDILQRQGTLRSITGREEIRRGGVPMASRLEGGVYEVIASKRQGGGYWVRYQVTPGLIYGLERFELAANAVEFLYV
jgi:hypothetical protein